MTRRRSFTVATIAFLLLILLVPCQVFADDSPPAVRSKCSADGSGTGIQEAFHAETGKVRFLGATWNTRSRNLPRYPMTPLPEDAGRQFFATYGALFGLGDPTQELSGDTGTGSGRGRFFVRFQQVASGHPGAWRGADCSIGFQEDVLSVNDGCCPTSASIRLRGWPRRLRLRWAWLRSRKTRGSLLRPCESPARIMVLQPKAVRWSWTAGHFVGVAHGGSGRRFAAGKGVGAGRCATRRSRPPVQRDRRGHVPQNLR